MIRCLNYNNIPKIIPNTMNTIDFNVFFNFGINSMIESHNIEPIPKPITALSLIKLPKYHPIIENKNNIAPAILTFLLELFLFELCNKLTEEYAVIIISTDIEVKIRVKDFIFFNVFIKIPSKNPSDIESKYNADKTDELFNILDIK